MSQAQQKSNTEKLGENAVREALKSGQTPKVEGSVTTVTTLDREPNDEVNRNLRSIRAKTRHTDEASAMVEIAKQTELQTIRTMLKAKLAAQGEINAVLIDLKEEAKDVGAAIEELQSREKQLISDLK